MKIQNLKNQIESETLNIHGSSFYSRQRGYTDALLTYHMESGDQVTACRQYLAASRMAVFHSVEAAHCPAEVIEAIFAPCPE